jgi:hypothetical protein
MRRLRFLWLLPLLWALVMVGARIHRGDEYGKFLIAALPAWPLGLLFRELVPWRTTMLVDAWICGIPLLALIGWGMDRARASLGLFLATWLVLAAVMAFAGVREHATLGKAISKNGSLWAYVFSGLGFMAPVAAFLALVLALMRRGLDGHLGTPRSPNRPS